jgi:hypothetical protein
MARKTTNFSPLGIFTVVALLLGLGIVVAIQGRSTAPDRSHAQASAYDALILTERPVGYWTLGNPGGVESDLSGKGHSGTYQGGTPSLTTMLNGDPVADFNGTSQYLTIPSSSDFSIPTTHQLTWEGWIRPDTLQYPTASNGYIDWMGKASQWYHYTEWEARMYSTVNSDNRPNRLSAYAFNLFPDHAGYGAGGDWQPYTNSLLQAGQWLHVVGEYQTLTTPARCNSAYPGSINIWVNGVKWNDTSHGDTGCMSQYSISPQGGSSPVNIGTMAMDFWFKGAIGKVAIYNYLLSQTQINAHFTAMTGVTPSGNCNQTATYTSGYSGTCVIPVPTVPNGSPIASTTIPTTIPIVVPTATPIVINNPTPTIIPTRTSTPLPVVTPTPVSSTSSNGLVVSQTLTSKWWSGYCNSISIKNNNSVPVTWTITFPVTGKVYNLWNGSWSQSGSNLTASGVSWNNIIKAGQTLTGIGYCSNY